jgi:hypothetical protein
VDCESIGREARESVGEKRRGEVDYTQEDARETKSNLVWKDKEM